MKFGKRTTINVVFRQPEFWKRIQNFAQSYRVGYKGGIDAGYGIRRCWW